MRWWFLFSYWVFSKRHRYCDFWLYHQWIRVQLECFEKRGWGDVEGAELDEQDEKVLQDRLGADGQGSLLLDQREEEHPEPTAWGREADHDQVQLGTQKL